MISINGVPVVPESFPDGTQKIDFSLGVISQEIIENKTVYITWLYESDQELFSLLCISKNIKEHFPWLQQALVMPYIPNARFDRVKEPSECFTLKYFAEIINSLGFVRVIVTDPHSDVSTALIDHVEVIRGASYITQTCCKVLKAESSRNLVIYFPDILAFEGEFLIIRFYLYKLLHLLYILVFLCQKQLEQNKSACVDLFRLNEHKQK